MSAPVATEDVEMNQWTATHVVSRIPTPVIIDDGVDVADPAVQAWVTGIASSTLVLAGGDGEAWEFQSTQLDTVSDPTAERAARRLFPEVDPRGVILESLLPLGNGDFADLHLLATHAGVARLLTLHGRPPQVFPIVD